MQQPRFLWRLYISLGALVLVTTGLVSILGGRWVERETLRDIERELHEKAVLLADMAAGPLRGDEAGDFPDRLAGLAPEFATRLTVLRADGRVLADSARDPAGMENHATRPEILAAGRDGIGTATRFSTTLGTRMMYVALAVRRDGELLGFVRTALPLTAVHRRRTEVRRLLVLASVVAGGVALALASVLARQVAQPLRAITETAERIAGGDWSGRVVVSGDDAVGRLGRAFNAMADELERRWARVTQSRNEVLTILSSMVEGVVAVDQAGKVVHMNGVAAAILEADPDQSLGKPMWQVTRVRDVCEVLELAGSTGTEVVRELHRVAPVGDAVIELHAAPLRDTEGRDAGAVVVLHDVTELRRLEAVRRDFVANVSHELKTPITAVRGLVETLLDDDAMDRETHVRFLGKIRDQSHRLSTIVTDLLALARIEGRDAEDTGVALDLREPVQESVASLRPRAEAKGVHLTLEVPVAPLHVRGDEEALRAMVDNLIVNAENYTPADGQIRVRLTATAGRAHLEIQDTGIGIEPEHHDRIFERFYRVDKARSRELGGTGLGLSIVRNVAVAHGGRVSVSSLPGRGSTFLVDLPLAPQA